MHMQPSWHAVFVLSGQVICSRPLNVRCDRSCGLENLMHARLSMREPTIIITARKPLSLHDQAGVRLPEATIATSILHDSCMIRYLAQSTPVAVRITLCPVKDSKQSR